MKTEEDKTAWSTDNDASSNKLAEANGQRPKQHDGNEIPFILTKALPTNGLTIAQTDKPSYGDLRKLYPEECSCRER